MTVCLDIQDIYRTHAAGLENDPKWLGPLREHALKQFETLGPPTTKLEAWRFTNPRAINKADFQPATDTTVDESTLAAFHLEGAEAHRLVLVNGRYQAELSQIHSNDIRVMPLSDALRQEAALLEQHLSHHADYRDESYIALNTALFEDGVAIIADGSAKHPVHLLHVTVTDDTLPRVSSPRNLVIATAGADVTLVETYVTQGSGSAWTNRVTEIAVGEGANVNHIHKVLENSKSYHTLALSAVLADNSTFQTDGLLLGGAIVRNDTRVTFRGSHAEANLNGLYMGRDSQILDNHITVNHDMPYNQSNQFYKGILDDKSRGVFSGTVVVQQDAQKTDASQVNRNLLLSDDARIDAMPRLEIYADDVKCAHGATTGHIDEDSLFYLQSRGIDKESAYDLLVYAFAHELVEKMPLEAARRQAQSFLFDRFNKARMIGE